MSFNISTSDIDTVEEAGMLDNSPIKLIKLKGGFWLGVGKTKNSQKETVLSAGSHPAIVKFNIQKSYPHFQPSMYKSELLAQEAIVDKHSHFLSEDLRKSGYDIYSVQNGNVINFEVTKNNFKENEMKTLLTKDALVVLDLKGPQELARALAGASLEKAIACGVMKIKIQK